ncbi:MAG TPA: allantoinase AllB [Candidatus Eisenbacteria bacterium]|nr:allantoinase AllB [Candidatus Eisenbacteria bacterium]
MTTPPEIPDGLPGEPDLIVRGRRVMTPEGEQAAAIHVRKGRIQRISAFEEVPRGVPVQEAGERVVMPGLVDTHVHINEPGRTEWEGFATATRAAAAGGITTLIEMPLNSIPATTSTEGFHVKLAAAEGKLWVDTGFWGGVVPGNSGELRGLWDAGCFGFKCFLVESGVAEFGRVSEADLAGALPTLVELGAPLLAHAELPGPIAEAAHRSGAGAPGTRYTTWLESRPYAAENEAIELLLRLSIEHSARLHIVHLASAEAIWRIRQSKAAGAAISVETCPHYLTFAAEEIPDGATPFKCAPPIREQANRERLWNGLRDGTIDMIATDHSPCPPAMKRIEQGDFLSAWGGIASLQLSLPAVWTEACKRGFMVSHLARWLCEIPARLAGLEAKKGTIAPGNDADLVIWNPSATILVDAEKLQHRHKLTPYAGRELLGIVETTFLRGKKIYDLGQLPDAPAGRILLRGQV